MNSPVYDVFVSACAHLYYDRITPIGKVPQRSRSGILYVGLHRNGAIDGFVYKAILPRAIFMISTQLRKNLLGRLFFRGIEVVRTKDAGERQRNAEAMTHCLNLLRAGGELFVFPEGTSTLGPHHLPFKSGAAYLWLEALRAGIDLKVIPVGIHYERAWAFRSRVEVVIGSEMAAPELRASDLAQLKAARQAIETGLETVGINVPTAEDQEDLEALGYAGTLGTQRSYFQSMKVLEGCLPIPVREAWHAFRQRIMDKGVWTHQRVPLIPLSSVWGYAGMLVILAPCTFLAVVLNAPVLAAAYFAGKKLADGQNVIALWRCLVGIPLFVLWVTGIALVLFSLGRGAWFLIYAIATSVGLLSEYRVKKLAVACGNSFRFPEIRSELLQLQNAVLQTFGHG